MKIKLSIYNTLLMVFMVFSVLIFMFYISGNIITLNAESQLREVVRENASEIEVDDGVVEFDDVDFFEKQVTTLIYSENGELLAGNIKNIENFMYKLQDETLKSVKIDDETYMIYDVLTSIKKYDEKFYVRGIISTSGVATAINQIFMLAFLIQPIFIILSAIGSYFICKKSLQPLDKMTETAEEISDNTDLSLRINLEKGDKELYRLANTFDKMFGKIEQTFLVEKQFTSDVSHELRTPTAVILAECELALEGNLDEKTKSLDVIYNQATKMKLIINNLLNLIRMQNGISIAELEEVNLSELLQIICEEYINLLPENLKLNQDIENDIILNLDYAMIMRVVNNLIDNSIKYIGNGTFITVLLKKSDEFIEFSVIDDGIGISEPEKVFNRFYQENSSRTASEEGSLGLGLAMVAQMVELNNGEIYVESEKDKGSKFTVKFNKK